MTKWKSTKVYMCSHSIRFFGNTKKLSKSLLSEARVYEKQKRWPAKIYANASVLSTSLEKEKGGGGVLRLVNVLAIVYIYCGNGAADVIKRWERCVIIIRLPGVKI